MYMHANQHLIVNTSLKCYDGRKYNLKTGVNICLTMRIKIF